jgi:hypothetical protein
LSHHCAHAGFCVFFHISLIDRLIKTFAQESISIVNGQRSDKRQRTPTIGGGIFRRRQIHRIYIAVSDLRSRTLNASLRTPLDPLPRAFGFYRALGAEGSKGGRKR